MEKVFWSLMDDLTKHWIGLSLSEKEGPGLCLKKEQAVEEFCLAAKFLMKQALNTDAIAKTLKPLWRSKNGFKVKNMASTLYYLHLITSMRWNGSYLVNLGA